ncbi:MAG: non-canonical purine NTP diphosphatase [Prevotella sp.]|nr:non-canonical purine NTP diphosphatase [Prevotella sp.]
MKIVFATNNAHKLEEVRQILGEKFEVLSLADIGCHEDIPETGQTLQENALQKANYVFSRYHLDCFADDTGLEVEALGGAPGIYSARYAAMEQPSAASHDSEANMSRLLRELDGKDNRRAQFRTVVALIEQPGRQQYFEGVVKGEITHQRNGAQGFGYDPIFRPDGYDQTFAELGAEVKNEISHRARAIKKLADYLLEIEN